MKDSRQHVIVVAGAMHTPHYQFAVVMSKPKYSVGYLATPGADAKKISDHFYNHFLGVDPNDTASTKVIFDFLKTQNFAVLIPKNLLTDSFCKSYCPDNAL
jgi:hypothetical protein